MAQLLRSAHILKLKKKHALNACVFYVFLPIAWDYGFMSLKIFNERMYSKVVVEGEWKSSFF